MTACPQDTVSFDDEKLSVRLRGRDPAMTILWSEIVTVEATALKVPDGICRIFGFAHPSGHAVELVDSSQGFPDAMDEVFRRFAISKADQESLSEVVPGAVVRIACKR